jgi:hypothetical protein
MSNAIRMTAHAIGAGVDFNDIGADDMFVDAPSHDALAAKVAALEADRDLLSQKACEAVLHYRTALGKLTDSFKYSTEVVTIAREALAHSTSITSENASEPK